MKYFLSILIYFLTTLQYSFAKELHVGKSFQYKNIKSAIFAAKNGDTVYVHQGVYKEKTVYINKSLYFIGVNNPVIDAEHKYEVVKIHANNVVFKGFTVQNSGYATLDDPGGIKVFESNNVTITQNILLNNFFGIYLQQSNNCVVSNNNIHATGTDEQQIGNGIHCWKSDSLIIKGNKIDGHRDGIYFEFVTNSVIWRNLSFKNIRYGLHFMFSNDDAYLCNVFKNNGAGVAVMFTNRVKMINNYFINNWGDASYGLLLKEISDSYILNNKFIANTTGIFMEGTNRILVQHNNFDENGWAMKIQASCMDNNIEENNFRGNTFDISTNGTLVLNTFEKNYWDNYEGYDLNKDQIGDVPYRPLSLFSVMVENNNSLMILFRSFMINLLDKSEKILPSLTPDNFIDNSPKMKAYNL